VFQTISQAGNSTVYRTPNHLDDVYYVWKFLHKEQSSCSREDMYDQFRFLDDGVADHESLLMASVLVGTVSNTMQAMSSILGTACCLLLGHSPSPSAGQAWSEGRLVHERVTPARVPSITAGAEAQMTAGISLTSSPHD
jgi:hypothetical protein